MAANVPKLRLPDEPPAFMLLEVDPPAHPALLVCDHASARIPLRLADLGLAPADRERHIAVDIGAAAVTGRLSAALGLPAILCNYSRLVVDCNRRLEDPTAFVPVSDGTPVPANQDLGIEERRRRAGSIYWPYHHAIRDRLRRLERFAPAPALIAVHTFTPRLDGRERPWHVGVLWDRDPRIAGPLLASLREDGDVMVGDNEPYSGRHPADFTIDHHAEAGGLPHVSIEIRQDLVATERGAVHWASVLAPRLEAILRLPSLYRHWAGT